MPESTPKPRLPLTGLVALCAAVILSAHSHAAAQQEQQTDPMAWMNSMMQAYQSTQPEAAAPGPANPMANPMAMMNPMMMGPQMGGNPMAMTNPMMNPMIMMMPMMMGSQMGNPMGMMGNWMAPQSMHQKSRADLTYAMGKSLDPEVYINLFKQMMTNPFSMMTSPMGTCAQCHEGEDLARYSAGMGPMLQMMNPGNWMNPNVYQQMMTAPMDPQTYKQWYDAYMKKFGGMMSAPQAESE